MKKVMYLTMLATTMMMGACTSDDNWDDSLYGDGTGTEETTTNAYSEMKTFTIATDKTTAEPVSTVAATYPEDGDAPSAQTFTTTVNIDMTSPTDPGVSGVSVTINGNDITVDHGSTEGICYVVTGTTSDGSLTINGSTNFELNLNNANITNQRSTAIDMESKKNAYLVLTGTNSVKDGTTADDSHKGAIYSKGKLLISGDGALEVYGTYNNGIHGKSNVVIDKGVNLYVTSTANHGIKAGSDMIINGGIVNVEVSANGAKAINGDTNVTINGGRTTTIATGNGEWEVDETLTYGGETKAAAGVACDGIFYMNGGELYAMATGSGGKGIKADLEGYITGGRTITTQAIPITCLLPTPHRPRG